MDAWAVIRAEQSKRRRNGIEKWPSDEDILTEFPSPLKPTPKSREEREEAKREEEEARARAKARGNTGETPDVDALVAKVAELTNALEFERATLARERQIVEALNAALEQKEAPPAKPQVLPEGVSAETPPATRGGATCSPHSPTTQSLTHPTLSFRLKSSRTIRSSSWRPSRRTSCCRRQRWSGMSATKSSGNTG